MNMPEIKKFSSEFLPPAGTGQFLIKIEVSNLPAGTIVVLQDSYGHKKTWKIKKATSSFFKNPCFSEDIDGLNADQLRRDDTLDLYFLDSGGEEIGEGQSIEADSTWTGE